MILLLMSLEHYIQMILLVMSLEHYIQMILLVIMMSLEKRTPPLQYHRNFFNWSVANYCNQTECSSQREIVAIGTEYTLTNNEYVLMP